MPQATAQPAFHLAPLLILESVRVATEDVLAPTAPWWVTQNFGFVLILLEKYQAGRTGGQDMFERPWCWEEVETMQKGEYVG